MARFDFSAASTGEIRQLVERAIAGDSHATATLIDGIAPVVQVRVARMISKRHRQTKGRDPRQDLEDLMQEVFASLFANRGKQLLSWDPVRGLGFLNFVGFLAEREAGMLMRTKKRNPWTEDPTMDDKLISMTGASASHEARVESRDLLQRIGERLVEQLSPQGRHYFQLLFVESRPVQTVAKETGTSTDALYAWRSRLGKLLRQLHRELVAEGEQRV